MINMPGNPPPPPDPWPRTRAFEPLETTLSGRRQPGLPRNPGPGDKWCINCRRSVHPERRLNVLAELTCLLICITTGGVIGFAGSVLWPHFLNNVILTVGGALLGFVAALLAYSQDAPRCPVCRTSYLSSRYSEEG